MTVAGIDVDQVEPWLTARIDQLASPLHFDRIGDGRSNLTFLVRDRAGTELVLRRPPLGSLLATAHDMAREHRILAAVHAAGLPVPRPVLLCEDTDVTGVPFYVMEHVKGRVVAAPDDAADLPDEALRRLMPALCEGLARLHAIDPDAVGLGDLGRREDFVARQLRRFRKQWEASRDEPVAAVEELADQLEAAQPTQRRTGIVHGDFRLGNAMMGEDGSLRAILDWELCALGDPLADLGWMLAFWPDGDESDNPLAGTEPAFPGAPRREELVAAYATAGNLEVKSADAEFFRALAFWRFAVIVQGVRRRAVNDPANADGEASAETPDPAALAAYGTSIGQAAGLW